MEWWYVECAFAVIFSGEIGFDVFDVLFDDHIVVVFVFGNGKYLASL